MTLIIVIITSVVSILCFTNRDLFDKLQFNHYLVYHKKQYHRLITHAFVHADWMHLIVNMIVLYSFGTGLEYYLKILNADGVLKFPPDICYLIMYFAAMVISSLTTLKKYRDVHYYNAVGASGAVSAVLFACIFFNPWQKLLFWAILPIPGILFGVLYLWYSHYMSKRSNDNINHDAHFLGALFGLTFPILLSPQLLYVFINQLIHFHL
jgi:membrane associated rhomboid family serine protease